MKKKTLIIDIDDTIVSSFELPFLNAFLGTNYTENDFKNYITEKLTDEAEKNLFCDYILSKETYGDDTITIKEGAIEAVKQLNENFILYLCSDYTCWQKPWNSNKFFIDKFQMLKKHFNYISPFQHIFLRDKQILHADIMIDDRIYNFGEHIDRRILFNAYHNKNISDDDLNVKKITRVNSWSEVELLLLK